MTGFSADWLALREPVDHASINADVRAAVTQHWAGHAHVSITDLGSGSGSSLRGLADDLPSKQNWRLVDYDQALLDHARESLMNWADSGQDEAGVLLLEKNQHQIRVEFVQTDLANGLPDSVLVGADMVTSSAFFDLVSAVWITNSCKSLADNSMPLYAMLTYDGDEVWQPPHAADAEMLRAFHKDQHQDKGFGPAAGPDAAGQLELALQHCAYDVIAGDSPWKLAAPDFKLVQALASGSADAVAAAGQVNADKIVCWREARQAATQCHIGHRDIFAVPRTN